MIRLSIFHSTISLLLHSNLQSLHCIWLSNTYTIFSVQILNFLIFLGIDKSSIHGILTDMRIESLSQFYKMQDGEFSWNDMQKDLKSHAFRLCDSRTLATIFFNYTMGCYQQFVQEIQSIQSKTISIDHTFRFGQRIVSRQRGSVKHQISSLLMGVNEEKAIIFFALLKNQSLKDAKDSLSNLAERNNGNISRAFTDKCCSDRKILQVTFKLKVLHCFG